MNSIKKSFWCSTKIKLIILYKIGDRIKFWPIRFFNDTNTNVFCITENVFCVFVSIFDIYIKESVRLFHWFNRKNTNVYHSSKNTKYTGSKLIKRANRSRKFFQYYLNKIIKLLYLTHLRLTSSMNTPIYHLR